MTQRISAMLSAATLAAAVALVLGVATSQAALGVLAKYAPLQTGASAAPEQVSGPKDVAVAGGLAFVVDAGHGRVAVYNATTGKYVRQIGTKGTGRGQLQLPAGIALVTDAGLKQTVVYVSDYNGSKIVAYRAGDGAFVSEFGVRGSKDGQLDQPSALTSDGNGVLWVNDWGNDRIQAFSTGGAFLAKLVDPDGAGSYGHVIDLAADSGGTVWATYYTQGAQGILQLSGADLHLLLKTPLAVGNAVGQLTGGSISSIVVQRDRGTGARTLWIANPNGYRVLRFGVGANAGDPPSAVDSWPAKGDEAFAYKPNVVRLGAGVFHVIGATAAYHVSTWGTKVVKPATATWAGAWTTNWGAFSVKLSGKRATGTYTHDSGRMTGTVSGRTLTGTWSESPTYKGPKDAGSFTITMSADGKRFAGTWKYADGTLGRDTAWTGRR